MLGISRAVTLILLEESTCIPLEEPTPLEESKFFMYTPISSDVTMGEVAIIFGYTEEAY